MVQLPFFIQLAPINPAFSGTPQEFATHMAERMRIVGPSGFYGIVVSDTMPTSNQGLWLKGGTKPYVWDDDLSTYVPIDLSDSLVSILELLATFTASFARGRIIFSDTEPVFTADPPVDERTNVIWAKTSAGVVLGLYAWNGLAWVRVPGVPPNTISAVSGGVEYSGTANDPDVTALTDLVNRVFIFIPNADSIAPSTFNYQSFGPKPLVKEGSKALVSGDLRANMRVAVMYDGTNWQLLSPVYQATSPLVVFATSADTATTTADISLSFTLPAGRQWSEIELFATNYLDSQSGSAVTSSVTFQWNCGALLLTPVTASASAGAGNSGQVFALADDAKGYLDTRYLGVVPTSIASINLVVRAALVFTGSYADGNWKFWGRARAV